MKLYAQHGYGDGQKIRQGIRQGFIDGVIFSPKDISVTRLRETLVDLRSGYADAERLFDPQFYATVVANEPNSRCGSLITDYSDYFVPRRRSELETEERVRSDLGRTLAFARNLDITSVISPNILVPRSLNSIEAAIAKNFIRNAKPVANNLGETRLLFATLAIGCEALRQHRDLIEFLTDLTLLEVPPDGFYVLAGVSANDGRLDTFDADTVAGIMLLNYVLKLNGFRVINGYSDLMTPFLGACGSDAGATGWWGNLRAFGLNRFAPESSGGRLPIPRYLSCALLNRITFAELEQLRGVVPEVWNQLVTDELYPAVNGSEPERSVEVLQSWNSLNELCRRLIVPGDVLQSVNRCQRSIERALQVYSSVEDAIFGQLDPKSDSSHLEPLLTGLVRFLELAEIGASEE
ncbi:MAG TPA: hypothetical protein VK178_14105 [Opitutaceae bacterium]|nr:hypothetical protein [Opitutaceae bacterium]